MASCTLSPAIQFMSTTRRGFISQPLPYVCRRCLAILTEDKKLGIQENSKCPSPETNSDSNQPSKSKTLPSSLKRRDLALRKHAKLTSKPRGRPRIFTKQYYHDVSPRDARFETTRCTSPRQLSLGLSECKSSTFGAFRSGTEITSLKEVASACANEVVRKLRDGKLKSSKKVCAFDLLIRNQN